MHASSVASGTLMHGNSNMDTLAIWNPLLHCSKGGIVVIMCGSLMALAYAPAHHRIHNAPKFVSARAVCCVCCLHACAAMHACFSAHMTARWCRAVVACEPGSGNIGWEDLQLRGCWPYSCAVCSICVHNQASLGTKRIEGSFIWHVVHAWLRPAPALPRLHIDSQLHTLTAVF